MTVLSQLLKVTCLCLFLSSLVFQNGILYAGNNQNADQMTIDEIANYMGMTWSESYTLVKQIFSKIETNPEFRKDLLEALKKRYEAETVSVRIANYTRTFIYLNTTEMLPQFQKKWETTEKLVRAADRVEPRIQLLIGIAKFLPESESVEFLIKIESDPTEPPIARFRATILLCAAGNKKAIEYVISLYEKAKKQFPETMLAENVSLNKTPGDNDGDSMPDNIEKGLFLDPNNPDTDGDGLLDGNDRNPLCKTLKEKLSDDQQIAQFILFLHAKYYYSNPRNPFKFNLLVVRDMDNYSGAPVASLFTNLTCTGIDGVILHLNNNRFNKFRDMYSSTISVINLHKFQEEQKDIKKFQLSETGRFFEMTFKNFDGIWLPIEWELRGMA